MIRYSFFILVNLMGSFLWGFEFAIDAKKEGDIPIERVQFFGERCSGTNYLQALIERNFFLNIDYRYGWKHFPAWVDMLPENYQTSGSYSDILLVSEKTSL